jgi:phage-related protein
VAGPIAISILADGDRARRELNSVADRGTRMGSVLGKAGRVAAVGLGAIVAATGAAVLAAGKLAAGAAEDEQGARRYAQTLQKVTGATKAQVAASEAWISKQGAALGVTDDELRPALSKLVTATKDVGQAQKLASLAMDVSAATGKDLGTVSTALMKAQNGQVSSLSRLGINTKNAAGETVSMAEATKRMSDTFGGAAASNADSLQGRIDRLKLRLSEAGEAIGYALLPPLLDFADWVSAKGIPVIERIASTLVGSLAPPLQAASGFLADLAAKFTAGGAAAGPITEALATYGETLTGTVIPAVVAVAGYIGSLLGPALAQVGGIIATKVLPIVSGLAQFLYGTLVPAVVAIATKVASNLAPVFEQLVSTFTTQVLPALSRLLDLFEKYRPTIQKVITVVVQVIGKVLELASAVLGKVLPPLLRLAGFLTGTLLSATITAIEVIAKIIAKLVDFGGEVVAAAKKVGEFATKVGQKIGDVVGFFADLPGKIKGAIGDAGGMLLEIGGQIVGGLKAGLENAWHLVTETVERLIKKIPGPIRKIMGIASPSKVTTKIGEQIAQGLAVGIRGGTAGVDAAVASVTDHIKAAFEADLKSSEKAIDRRYDAIEKKLRKRLKGKALDKAIERNERERNDATKKAEKRTRTEQQRLLTLIKAQAPALRAQGAEQDRITTALAAQNAEMERLVQASTAYVEQVRSATLASASITSFGSGTGFGSIDQLIAQRTAGVQQAERFTDVINQLVAAGLNTQDLQDLISAGVANGLGTAEALLAGGPGVIATMNALSVRLDAAGASLGTTMANRMYGVGITTTQSLINGLTQDQAALDAVIAAMAASIDAAFGEDDDSGKKKKKKKKKPKTGDRTASAALARTAAATFNANITAKSSQTLTATLLITGEQQDQLARGRSIQADLTAYQNAGGR